MYISKENRTGSIDQISETRQDVEVEEGEEIGTLQLCDGRVCSAANSAADWLLLNAVGMVRALC